MTWSFSASGHVQSEPNTEQAERKLANVLAEAVRSLPADDVVTAVFTGNHFSGDLRTIEFDTQAHNVEISDEQPESEGPQT